MDHEAELTETEIQGRVEKIIRSMVSYDDEPVAIAEITGLFRKHHCASCDMHSCGDLAPERRAWKDDAG